MKLLLTLSLLLPNLALAAGGPHYEKPAGTPSHKELCVTTELVSTDSGKSWKSESTSIEEEVSYWIDGDGFAALRESKNAVNYSRFTEEVIDRSLRTRVKNVEDWKLVQGQWVKAAYTLDINIVTQDNQPVRVIERLGNVAHYWDVKTYADGDDTIAERVSRNPSSFSREGRNVSSRIELCRSKSGTFLL